MQLTKILQRIYFAKFTMTAFDADKSEIVGVEIEMPRHRYYRVLFVIEVKLFIYKIKQIFQKEG